MYEEHEDGSFTLHMCEWYEQGRRLVGEYETLGDGSGFAVTDDWNGVACRARAGARPEDRTRRCSVIHHWASPDACSAPAVTAFLRRRATAMATPFQSSVADSTLVSEQ